MKYLVLYLEKDIISIPRFLGFVLKSGGKHFGTRSRDQLILLPSFLTNHCQIFKKISKNNEICLPRIGEGNPLVSCLGPLKISLDKFVNLL